jgi:hypothetical protein
MEVSPTWLPSAITNNSTKGNQDKYLRQEYRIHFGAVLEVLQDTHSLNLTSLPMDVRLF